MWPNRDLRWVVATGTGIAPPVQHSRAGCVLCTFRRASSRGQGGCQRWDCPTGSHNLHPGSPKLIPGTVGNRLPAHPLGNHRTGSHTPRQVGMNRKHKTRNHQAIVHQEHGSPLHPRERILPPDRTNNRRLVPRTGRPNNRCIPQATFPPNQHTRSGLMFGMAHCTHSRRRKRPR